MKKSFLCAGLAVLIFLCGLHGLAWAGAWTNRQKGMYNKLALNYFVSQDYYDDDSDRHGLAYDGKFTDLNLNWYLEYGLTDDLTLIGSLYYKWLEEENDYFRAESNGVGDLEVGLKWKLIDEPLVLALQGLAKIAGPYDDEVPGLGSDQTDFELRLLLGKSLYPLPLYLGLEAAYRWRTKAPADEWRLLAEIGGNAGKYFYGRVKLDCIFSANNAENGASYSNITLTPEYDLITLDTTIGVNFNQHLSLELSYKPTLSGQNTAAGYTLSSALIYSF
ncbi:MAG: hypothetical protein JXR89_03700 [Deltaproteobacteria bacterium]|nr:hypothetical protein [Deltaproteobacteria bacterium]